MDLNWITTYILVIALLTGGLGLARDDGRKQWKGTLRLLKSMVRHAPCKGGRCSDGKEAKGPQERYIIRDLLMDYDKLSRPVTKDIHNVTVHFSASLMELLNHAESTGRVGMRMMMRMWWHDPNLAWDEAEYGGVEKISLPSNLVWTPDISLYNGINSQVNKEVKLTVYSNGDILWMPPAEFQVTCTYQFRSDSWSCPLRFRSLSYDSTQVDIVPFKGETDIDMSELEYNANWRVMESSGKREAAKYPCCEEIYPTMQYMIGVRMKIGHPALGKRSAASPYTY